VFTKYLEWMRARELIEMVENDGHQKVRLTRDGSESYRRLVVWINETVHGRV
jgi:predicted transcriptional regulator